MSWLFGRRSEEDDSDEWTDASSSDDDAEYSDASSSEEEEEDDQQGREATEMEQPEKSPPVNDNPNVVDNAGGGEEEEEEPVAELNNNVSNTNDSTKAKAGEEDEPQENEVSLPEALKNDTSPAATGDSPLEKSTDAGEEGEASTATTNSGQTTNKDNNSRKEENGVAAADSTSTAVIPQEEEINQKKAELEPESNGKPPLEESEISKEEETSPPVTEEVKDTGDSTIDATDETNKDSTADIIKAKEETISRQDETDDAKEVTDEAKQDEEDAEEVTSTHEKRSLLVLAAEHDRVDILKAILADDSEDKDTLLNSSIPPLHISIAYGSSNAVQSLLRMGADPSIRPDVNKIKGDAEAEGEEQLVDIPNMGRFDKLSAWELAFGKPDVEGEATTKPKKSGWFRGGSSKNSIDIAPSKLEGIRHAFTAEALRCIGSDEVDRLKQLLDSGMPSTIDIGGKNLYDWAVEMGALQCEELLRPAEAARSGTDASPDGENGEQQSKESEADAGSSAVRDRSKPGTESLSQLANRIDELESLSKALSSCLDNLAEEVSVCHGLLLMGGGASALASHVRSLKNLKENKIAELDRLEEAWENSEDEMAYWVKESGEQGKEIAELMSPAIILPTGSEHAAFERSPEEEQAHKQQLKAQAALLENKIRKLRASITDLSEENTGNLAEVENRGLSGGIKLVRGLREELREIEFTLNETKSAEALCRAKIKLIQSKMGTKKHPTSSSSSPGGELATISTEGGKVDARDEGTRNDTRAGGKMETNGALQHQHQTGAVANEDKSRAIESNYLSTTAKPRPSEAIATGQSTAIALKNKNTQGYLPVDLWRIILRIIGLGSSTRSSANSLSSGANVMIV